MRFVRLPLWVTLAALLASCSDEPVAPPEYGGPALSSAGYSGPSANGQAKLPPEYWGELQPVSFHAREKANGSVSGSFQTNTLAQTVFHAELDCLVVNGNEAILGGVVTQLRVGPDFPWPICLGDRIWLKVRDNGEGTGADPDEFSDYWFEGCGMVTFTQCGAYPVEEFPDFVPELIPVQAGNIQVRE